MITKILIAASILLIGYNQVEYKEKDNWVEDIKKKKW